MWLNMKSEEYLKYNPDQGSYNKLKLEQSLYVKPCP